MYFLGKLCIVATCLPTDSCLLNGHLNLTLTLTSTVKVTEMSRKASVGRQGDTKFQQATHPPPPENFLDTSRGPTPKCYTFLKPLITPKLNLTSDAKILRIFWQTQNMKKSRGPLPSVIPLWKPLMTPNTFKYPSVIPF